MLVPKAIVVNKSTVPVGSTRFVQRVLAEAGTSGEHVTVASNPEFLREGQAVHDFLHPDRIVIGCEDPESAVRVSELYRGVHAPVLVTDPASAEMIKYASNAFLATKISFINAIANLCESVDADVREVAIGMGYDARIGFQFLHPGPGFGGSCFPKDVAALLYTARQAGYDFPLLDGVVGVNHGQHDRIVDKVRAAAGDALAGAEIAIWGLTFKADTDDLRDSPSLVIARKLLDEGAIVRALRSGRRRSGRGADAGARRPARSVRSGRRCRRGRAPHGVGGAALARLRAGASFDAPARGGRRPEPARSGRDAAPGVRIQRNRPPVSRIVVTGGGGFVGSHLCEALLERGDTVVAVDNFSHEPPRERRASASTTPASS